MESIKQGVLLVNLGTPDACTVPAIRRYLREFLMDARVIDIPYLLRFMLVPVSYTHLTLPTNREV